MVESRDATVYFEHIRIGQVVRVAAVCALTGTEVVVMGPANTAPSALEKLALRKLKLRIERDGSEPLR
ncbi:serine hydroxymethyltransferase [Phreatobacter aquaticus]|uniref:Serine hydroxymethyltransferase n=1 Tax=Phreatobacter aquaticus TaxID=2570229 RepID=A0A4D7QMU8_9HYPH|nr:serine hydroxymethyltransferase [Phreatobacter aquaticus]QCK86836.1 serine hydroxymethyltransferase [Phreatobacter aquaticus]